MEDKQNLTEQAEQAEQAEQNVIKKAEGLAARAAKYTVEALKWGLISVIVGSVCGGVGALFALALGFVTGLRADHAWLLYLLPAAGALIVFLYNVCGIKNDHGANLVIASIRAGKDDRDAKIHLRTAPLIFVGTLLTHLCGGSAGREGAALQIGGCLGTGIGRALRMDEKSVKTVTICGMAAVFSALFGTPVTAAVFSMEVISVGVMYYSAFLPAVISSIIASAIAKAFGCPATSFSLAALPERTVVFYLKIILLAAVAAVFSIIFTTVMHGTGRLAARLIPDPYLRVVAGGAVIIALTLLERSGDYNGAGGEIIARAVEQGRAVPWAFAAKLVFTAVTLGCGFKGGEIVPAFFTGATLGCVVGPLVGLDPGLSAAVGLVAVFCGVVNCPLTSLILAVELFGTGSVGVFAVVCAVSYVLSGYYGLYSSQNIVYSKLRTEYVNKHVK